MKDLTFIIVIILSMLSALLKAQNSSSAEKCIPCEKLAELKLPDLKITESVTYPEGNPYCKVLGTIGKEIRFELLLPSEWNGIFVMGGGGGFVGSIQNFARSKVNDGYATSGTDTGHEGKKGISAE